jgi:FMN phosphatase YigB (HAD superfamily)
MSPKYIFVDLDETLISTTFVGRTRPDTGGMAISYIQLIGNETEEVDYYRVRLREGARMLLNELRAVAPEHVRLLTAAQRDYAEAINTLYQFGFSTDDIHSREDMRAGNLTARDFPAGDVYLIDNLPRHENRVKIDYLRAITDGDINYIKVAEYFGHIENDFAFGDIQGILDAINRK